MLRMVSRIFDIRPGEGMRTVVTGPVYHSAPNGYALSAARDGGLVVLQPRFDAEDLLRQVERHRITHLHMVPTMFVRLLKLPESVRRKYDLSSLKFVTHGAAPCPPDVKRQMIEWWGPIINEYYGGTETGRRRVPHGRGGIEQAGHGRAADRRARPSRSSMPPAKSCGPGEIGEVYLRIGSFPDFTYNGMDDKRREVERNGLITCGDVGYIDDDGYLFLCDRVRDMVISGGVNIYPAEIEAVLIGMPGVQDCAVFGIPDEEYGEQLAAYIELQEGATQTEDAVRSWLRARVAGYKVPKLVGVPARPAARGLGKDLQAQTPRTLLGEGGASDFISFPLRGHLQTEKAVAIICDLFKPVRERCSSVKRAAIGRSFANQAPNKESHPTHPTQELPGSALR